MTMLIRSALFLVAALLLAPLQPAAQQGGGAAPTMLDYEVYKTRVQPILMTAREGNARCVACHGRGGGVIHHAGACVDGLLYSRSRNA